ncbi:MAG: 16S rRNA (cytidine(1402)-2'-O)-methyltransferase [Patescibacteria group bacterium]|nr:16S rRNA (cytidine(1402)-2'-O)-methyltransferase [Patescibacteria group bacterium]
MTKLYIVSTPIGNLKDISRRALLVFKKVDFIICEDTRHTLKLLNYYDIKKPLVSYHQHSKIGKIDKIIEKLSSGQSAALVSDAGTPGIADPGGKLLEEIYNKLEDKVKVLTVPGSSALTAAVSISGLPSDHFEFLGFLPHKKGRQKLFKEIAQSDHTIIFFESPYRILKTLKSLSKYLDKKRKVVVAREMTKIHEEVIRGDIDYVYNYFENNKDKVKGEFVVLIAA